MIRLRDSDGAVSPLSANIRFIEICSQDGKLAAVIMVKTSGEIVFADSRDEFIHRYASTMHMEVCPVINLPESALLSPLNAGR